GARARDGKRKMRGSAARGLGGSPRPRRQKKNARQCRAGAWGCRPNKKKRNVLPSRGAGESPRRHVALRSYWIAMSAPRLRPTQGVGFTSTAPPGDPIGSFTHEGWISI